MRVVFMSVRSGLARAVGVDQRAFRGDNSPERVKEREAPRATHRSCLPATSTSPREGGDAEEVI